MRHLKNGVRNYDVKSVAANGLPASAAASSFNGSRAQSTTSAAAAGRSLEAPLPKGWERGSTEENIPYYMNHAEETTQWDHPKYSGNNKYHLLVVDIGQVEGCRGSEVHQKSQHLLKLS